MGIHYLGGVHWGCRCTIYEDMVEGGCLGKSIKYFGGDGEISSTGSICWCEKVLPMGVVFCVAHHPSHGRIILSSAVSPMEILPPRTTQGGGFIHARTGIHQTSCETVNSCTDVPEYFHPIELNIPPLWSQSTWYSLSRYGRSSDPDNKT